MVEPYAEDAVFDVSAVFTDAAPARGRENIARYWKELQETWGGGLRVDPLELLDLGGGRAVLNVRLWGKGTLSEVEVDQRFAILYEIGDHGKISRALLLRDVATAITVAGSAFAEACWCHGKEPSARSWAGRRSSSQASASKRHHRSRFLPHDRRCTPWHGRGRKVANPGGRERVWPARRELFR